MRTCDVSIGEGSEGKKIKIKRRLKEMRTCGVSISEGNEGKKEKKKIKS